MRLFKSKCVCVRRGVNGQLWVCVGLASLLGVVVLVVCVIDTETVERKVGEGG